MRFFSSPVFWCCLETLRAVVCWGSIFPVPPALEDTAWNYLFQSWSSGLAPPGFAHPTRGWGCAAPQIIPATLALPNQIFLGMREELGWALPSKPAGAWPSLKGFEAPPASLNLFHIFLIIFLEKSLLMGNGEGHVGSRRFWILYIFFEIFKRFFLNVAFDLVLVGWCNKRPFENFLHLQFIDKCVLQNSSPTPQKNSTAPGRKNLNTAHKCYQLDVFNHCVEYRNFSLNWAKFKPFLHMALTGCKVLLVRPAFPPKNIRVNIGSSWEKKGKRENPWDLMLIKCFPREFMAQPWRRCLLSKCAVTWLWADRQHLRCEER